MSNALREVSRRSLQDPRRADTPVRWRVAHIWRLSQRSRRRSGPSRNRVAADRAKARAVRYFSNRKEASSPVGPPKQSLDGAPSRVQMIAIGRATLESVAGINGQQQLLQLPVPSLGSSLVTHRLHLYTQLPRKIRYFQKQFIRSSMISGVMLMYPPSPTILCLVCST